MTWHRVYSAWVALVFGLIALACFFGPEVWFSAHSLRSFHDLTHIPWPVVGIAFLAVPIMLAHRRLRLAAYVWGFLLSVEAVFTLWLFTIIDRQIINVVISLLVTLVPLVLLTGIRWSILTGQRLYRGRG